MFNLSRKEIVTGLIVTVVGGLILIVLNEKIRKRSDPEKVEITNLPPQKDTLLVREVGGKKDTVEKYVPVTIRDTVKDNQISKKPSNIDEQQSVEKTTIAQVINNGINVRFAVLAVTDGRKDNQLASVFENWLKNHGSASNLVLLNSFIDQGFFNRILDGETNAVLNTNAKQGAEYICVVKSSVDFNQKSSIEGLKFANCKYSYIIVDTKTGKTIDSDFDHMESSSDITEAKAKARAETFLLSYLLKQNLNF